MSNNIFLQPEEFDLFTKYGKKYSSEYPEAHSLLRQLYDKLGILVEGMRKYGYIPHIRRNPQNQGQRYWEYHWAQLTPEYSKDSEGIIFFVVDFTSEGLGLHIDCNQRAGYQTKEEAEGLMAWEQINVQDLCVLSKEDIIERINSYCKKNKRNFLLYGKEFGVKSCINLINMEKYITLLKGNHNLILSGAPGTGKTHLAKKIASSLGADGNHIGFVQFHPSYDYTDFIEGLRPIHKDGSTEIGFERKDGVFLAFCRKAIKSPGENFVFIIDEINRGEISKIFGELFFAIDPGYRGVDENGHPKGLISTQYNNLWGEGDVYDNTLSEEERKKFYIPDNVYIIGTMNDIDRSVESMDFAFRRRFAFKEILASENTGMLDNLNDDDLKNAAIRRMESLNKEIESCPGLNSSYHVGASYFLKLKNYKNDTSEMQFEQLWSNHLEPLLREYLRGMPDADALLKKLRIAYELESNVEKNETSD